MATKQWETVMLSKQTKEKLKQLKGKQTYESYINQLLEKTEANPVAAPVNIDFDRIITDYLESMKAYMKENSPSEKLLEQARQLAGEYNQLEEELIRSKKRISVLTQENDRLKKRKR
jgi:hypothetical protein